MFIVIFSDISWFYAGQQQFKVIVLKNTAVKLISFICLVAVIRQPGDLELYIGLSQLTMFVTNLLLWRGVGRYLRECSIQMGGVGAILLFPQLANQLIGNVVRIIGSLTGNMTLVAHLDIAL